MRLQKVSEMGKVFSKLLIVLLCFPFAGADAQNANNTSFKVMPLGIKGGLEESNLSAYMIAPVGTNNFVCADAGTIRYGIEKAVNNKAFKVKASEVFREYIKGYLVSHAHLDHVAGLIINSPEDTTKNIYALPAVIDVLRDKYFTWQSWANFADQGDKPLLNKYHYISLPEAGEMPLVNTGMNVKAFALSHSNPYQSTAFLLNSQDKYLLYLGDTGSDTLEKSDKLLRLWNYITPLIKGHQLKAIFIEVSFPDEQPEKQLFGHLTPRLLMDEMAVLSNLCGAEALQTVSIVITHIKPPTDSELTIKKQLKTRNKLHLKLMYPVQGKMLYF